MIRPADGGVRHVLLIIGGGATHLSDAIGHEKSIQYIGSLRGPASAMAGLYDKAPLCSTAT